MIFSDDYLNFDLGEEHPMNPNRLKSFKILLESLYELDSHPFDKYPPGIASEESILSVHDSEYVKALKKADETLEENINFGLGFGDCPIFPEVEKISRTIVGGTLKAANMVLDDTKSYQVAFNVLGGLHHAWPAKASGFCYYNDCNIAIEHALKKVKRVLYIDTDTHAGDGVNGYFFKRNDVLTLSIHETGMYLFPGTDFENEIGEGTGKGYTWNLPIIPGTSDDEYLPVVLPLISKAFEVQKPDIVFWQCGVDTYILDPLAHIRLTTRGYSEIAKRIRLEICNNNTPLVMMGGGGYSPIATARGWLTQYLTLIGINPLPTPHGKWITYCKDLSEDFPFCGTLIDDISSLYSSTDSKKILEYNQMISDRLVENISPFI
jgi:acetoin utilization protein AcuC